jgi:hypothetical protein
MAQDQSTDWSSIISGGGGLLQGGLNIASGFQQAAFSKQEAAIQTREIQLQMQADQTRRTAMELNARRRMTENVRQSQMARSLALSVSSNQGAQFGSGAAAGMGQATAQGAYANLGVSENLQLGENMFNINSQIDAQRIAMAQTEGKAAESKAMFSGLSSLAGNAGGIFKGASALAPLLMV